jgi:hypothetical protein
VYYAMAQEQLAAAGQAASSALDSFLGPPTTQTDVGVPHGENPPPPPPPDP